MKINLLLNNEKISFDPELLEEKVKKLILLFKEQEQMNLEGFNTSNIHNQVHNVALLIQDMGYHLTAKEVQNIIKKDNPADIKENLINNLYEALGFFLGKKKLIHQNNITILCQIILNNTNKNVTTQLFRNDNDIDSFSFATQNFKILDFNNIPSLFDQLIEFINVPGTISNPELSSFLNMQIVLLHNLAMAPFAKYNALLSKIISLWYLNIHNVFNDVNLFFEQYLNTIRLHPEEFQKNALDSILTRDYTNFALFMTNKLSEYTILKQKTKKIMNYLRKKRKYFLASHEGEFLFLILYFDLNQFDWKKFKKTGRQTFSKQYIMINLTRLERNYDLLSSKTFKNRKFFFQSRFLKSLLGMLNKSKIKQNFKPKAK